MDIASIINPTTPDDASTYCSSTPPTTPKPFFLSATSGAQSPTDAVFHVCVNGSTTPLFHPDRPKRERIAAAAAEQTAAPAAVAPPTHAMPIKKRPLQQHQPSGRSRSRRKRADDGDYHDAPPLLCLSSSSSHNKRRRRPSKRHPSTKKGDTDAAMAYDTIDPEVPESEVFDPDCWVPSVRVFEAKPTVSVRWKGTPLDIRSCRYYDQLHPGEVAIASALRLFPEQYIRCKRTLILAAQDAYKNNTLFRKSEAQKLCRIDVNKISHLWSAFGRLGWLGPRWPGNQHHSHVTSASTPI